MQMQSVIRWTILFLGILGAILIADAASTGIVTLTGLKGWPASVLSFLVYALMLFAAIALLKKYGHIDIFTSGRN